MSLLERTKSLLKQYQIHPNRALGQSFTIEDSVFDSLIEYASLDVEDVILEIGAGLGFLTELVACNCKRVVAVEKDDRLAGALRNRFSRVSNVEVVHGDFFRVKIPEFNKIVSIPPYGISSPLVLWFFKNHFDCAVLVLQKEFANRLVSPVGSDGYGWLTVLVYYHMDCELLSRVPKEKFYPEPAVDSLIVRLRPRSRPPFDLEDKMLFTRLVQSLFTQRNRKVSNAILPFTRGFLRDKSKRTAPIPKNVPFHYKRVRELAPEDFGVLANELGA